MDKGKVVLKPNLKGILDTLLKKLLVVIVALGFVLGANEIKKYIAKKNNITGSIFSGDIIGTILMVFIYIIIAILFLLFLIALFRFSIVFYELKRVTTIDFESGKILVKKYDFPFEKQIIEKKFDSLVGAEITQNTIDRAAGCGTLYLEYLVLSKNDSKLRGIEIPYVENPVEIKDKLFQS